MNYIFPFGRVPHGSKVVLYGGGEIGKTFYAQLNTTNYAEVVMWIDKNFEHFRRRGMMISSPNDIKNLHFDYIVIAIKDYEIAYSVYNELISERIDANRVILPRCEWKADEEQKKLYSFEGYSGVVGIVNNAYWDNPGCQLSAYSIQEFVRREFPDLAAVCLYYEQVPVSPADYRFVDRHEKFEYFRKKHLLMTEKFRKLDAWPLGLDFTCCVATIDVWRPDLAKSKSSYFYFLKFLKDKYKKIGFGVSLATDNESALLPIKERYKTLTNGFSVIYARESNAVDFLAKCTDSPVKKTLDACFLHDANFYERILSQNLHWEKSNKFIYVYLLSPNPKPISFAIKLAKRIGIRVKYDCRFKKDIPTFAALSEVNSFREIACGPSEFITNIKYADYVITDSFHATVFSIIFHKEFYIFPRGSINVRMLDLLGGLGLKRRFDCEEIYNEIIDYPKVDKILDRMREQSADYLRSAIQKAVDEKKKEPLFKKHVGKNIYCCGCNSCAQSCNVKAISMIKDDEGFIIPYVDETKCVGCGKCLSVCPVVCHDDTRIVHKSLNFYAGLNKNEKIVASSSSGGIFTALAECVIKHKGIVYGCGWDGINPKHMSITKLEEIDKLRLSKYVQSDTGETFTEVKKQLKQGSMVLYVGTPCQIAGLKLFLGEDYQNLYCVDIICHGVPSAGCFEKHVHDIEKKENISIERFEFRKKPFQETLNRYNEKIQSRYYYYIEYRTQKGERGWREEESGKDDYYASFLKNANYNEACYVCPYAKRERTGDITIGDYRWAVEYHDDLKQKVASRGYAVSCVIVNTEKGRRFLDEIRDQLEIYPTKFEWIAKRNAQLLRPNDRPDSRNNVIKIKNNK